MTGPTLTLAVGLLVGLAGVALGVWRTRSGVELFHPLIFPVIYVTLATLLPAWWIYARHIDLGYVNRGTMTLHTPLHLTLAVAGFTVGAAIPFRRRVAAHKAFLDHNTLVHAGYLTLAVPLLLAGRDLANNVILTRFQGQSTYTFEDSINAAALVIAPASIALILAGRAAGSHLLRRPDWMTIGVLVTMLGLNGRRGAALAIMLVILVFAGARHRGNLRALVGGGLILYFAYAVVNYRTATLGEKSGLGSVELLLRDVGSVAYTTGMTDRLMFDQTLGGSTLVAAIVRQLPSVVTTPLIGPLEGTAAYRFRALAGVGNNTGFGYSIPAEGVLNFGAAGAFCLPLLIGLALAWLYAHFRVDGERPTAWLYAVAVGTLPFAWRSDMLGAIKGVLYPAIIFAIAIAIARTMHLYTLKSKQRRSEAGSARTSRVRT